MSVQDPFYVVKEDILQSVNGMNTLFDKWQELVRSTSPSTADELEWTQNELSKGVTSIEWDLQDLEDTISIVENNRAKYRIDQAELDSRKKFISSTRSSIISMKDSVQNAERAKQQREQRNAVLKSRKSASGSALGGSGGGGGGGSGSDYDEESGRANPTGALVKTHTVARQEAMEAQNEEINELHTTVKHISGVATAINRELAEHDQLLEELDTQVDSTSSRLRDVTKKINQLIEETGSSKQLLVIVVLAVVLIILVVIAWKT